MQAMENGLYRVWLHVKNIETNWFLCRIHNGHVTVVGFEDEKVISASRIMTDNVPFMRVSARELAVAGVVETDKPDDILIKLEDPEFSPWHFMAHERGVV